MFENIYYALKISWNANPIRVILDFIVRLLFRSYSVFYGVFFLGYVLKVVEDNNTSNDIWLLVGISIFIMVAYDFLAAWYYNAYKPYADQNVFKIYKDLIYNKASDVDLECYENTEFYNKYTKASNEIINRFEGVLSDVSELLIDIIMNTYLFIVILQLDLLAVIICFFPIFIKFVIGKKLNSQRYKLYTANAEPNRHKDYIKRTFYLKEYSKEIHTSNIFVLLNEKFKAATDEIIINIKKYAIKIAALDFLNSAFVKIFTYFIAIIYASYKALVAKSLSIGDYIILVNAISRLSSMLVGFVDRTLRLNEHSKYIDNIKEFLNTPSSMPNGENHITATNVNSIELKNVSFSYHSQTNECLNDISLKINAGERIAIVGLNGAGKTSLVKLLMRLYDVSKGEILVNGINIKKYNIKEYRKIFSTVFQDYKIFAATVSENVLLDVNNDKNAEVDNALKNSGIYEFLNEKYGEQMQECVLTKEFAHNGLVLSGGQFQKIAIARAFVKKGGIAILDEPSSALDPIAEKNMFETLLTACKDKMVIFISHRLSAAALADRIYVLENGRITEAGTHEQLLDNKGSYYNMYHKQNKVFSNDGELNNEE